MKTVSNLSCIIIVFSCLLFAEKIKGQLSNSPWPMYMYDLQHTGRSPNAGPNDPEKVWSYNVDASNTGVDNHVVIGADGTIYAVHWGKGISALRPDGSQKWYYNPLEYYYRGFTATPALDINGTLYICGGNNNFSESAFYAINPDGSLKWKITTGSGSNTSYSSPAIGNDGTIFIGSANGSLYAVYPDGSIKWKYSTGTRIDSSPAIATDGTIYFGCQDGYMYALNPIGTLKWKYKIAEPSSAENSSPSIGPDGTIYIGSTGRKILAINPNGSLKWSISTTNTVSTTPSIGRDGTLYIASDFTLKSINPENGNIYWQYYLGNIRNSSPIIDAQGTIFCSADNIFYALNPNGTKMWSYEFSNNIYSTGVIDKNKQLYVTTFDNVLHTFANKNTGQIPDLVIDQLSTEPINGTLPGTKVKITAKIKDLSAIASARCRVNFYYDDKNHLIETKEIYIPVGLPGYAEINWDTQNYFVKKYKIIASITNSNPIESNLNNNESDIEYELYSSSNTALLSPNGGENWLVGSTQNITWTSSGVTNVKIENTTNNGTTWTQIIASVAATPASYSWTVPNTPSTNCKVRISDASNASVTDVSNNVFTISAVPTITVTSPNGGENWQVGLTQNITWTSSGVTNVKIEYSTNNGTSWSTIIASVAATPASYSWIVPNTPNTQCKVRISDAGNTVINDISDKPFQLSSAVTNPCPGTPTVTYSGKIYNTVLIGSQCWLRENLDVGTMIQGSQNQSNNSTIEKYCHDNDPNNCSIYGGLYQWAEAMQYITSEKAQGLCPSGWHIPTNAELQTLGTAVSNNSNALKAVGQDTGSGAGTNTSGFSGLLAGYRSGNGSFGSLGGGSAYFWSSTEYNATIAYFLNLYYNVSILYYSDTNYKEGGFSVRCLKDETILGLKGDANGDGIVLAFDALRILQFVIGVYSPTNLPLWNYVSDVNMSGVGDGTVGAIDAAAILYYVVHFRSWTGMSFKSTPVAGNIGFGKITNDNGNYKLPINLSNTSGVHSAYIKLDLGDNVEFKSVTSTLPEDWIAVSNYANGKLHIAMAGVNPLADGSIAFIQLKLKDKEAIASIKGSASLNDQINSELMVNVKEIPTEFTLGQNYPNPFNPTTNIKYTLAKNVKVYLAIYNMLGQRIRTLVDREQEAGYYTASWDGTNDFGYKVSSGIYIYRLSTDNFISTIKMNLLK